MNKKLISLLVAICLVIGLLPVMSIAADPATSATVTLWGTAVTVDTDDTTADVPAARYWTNGEEGATPVAATAADAWNYSFAIIDGVPTVTLKNANYTYAASLLTAQYDGVLKVAYEGTNSIVVPYNSASGVNHYFVSYASSTNTAGKGHLYIEGADDAVLNVTGGDNSASMLSLSNKAYLTITGGTFNIEKTNAGGVYAVIGAAYSKTTIENCTLNVKHIDVVSGKHPVVTMGYSSYGVTINNANVSIENNGHIALCLGVFQSNMNGVMYPAALTITGDSNVKIVNNSNATNKDYSGTGIYASKVTVKGGNLEVDALTKAVHITTADTNPDLSDYNGTYEMFTEKGGTAVSTYTATPYFKVAAVVASTEPTDAPTAAPTDAPTAAPTDAPTAAPTDAPSETAAPSETTAPTSATVPATLATAYTLGLAKHNNASSVLSLTLTNYDTPVYAKNTIVTGFFEREGTERYEYTAQAAGSEDDWNAKLIWHTGDEGPTLYLDGFKIDSYRDDKASWVYRGSSGAAVNLSYHSAIYAGETAPLKIVLTGEDSYIRNYMGIHYTNALTIESEGDTKLTMLTNSSGIVPRSTNTGVYSSAGADVTGYSLTLNANLDITVTGGQSWSNGIIATNGGNLIVNGGNINVNSYTNGPWAITVRNSGNITVNGGNLTALGGYRGVRVPAGEQVYVNGGSFTAYGEFSAVYASDSLSAGTDAAIVPTLATDTTFTLLKGSNKDGSGAAQVSAENFTAGKYIRVVEGSVPPTTETTPGQTTAPTAPSTPGSSTTTAPTAKPSDYTLTIYGKGYSLTDYDVPVYLKNTTAPGYYNTTKVIEVTEPDGTPATDPTTGKVKTQTVVDVSTTKDYGTQTKDDADESNYNAKLVWHTGDNGPTLYLRSFVLDNYDEELAKWRYNTATATSALTYAAIFTDKDAPLKIVLESGESVMQTYEGIHYQNDLTIEGADDASLTIYANRTGILPTKMGSGYAAASAQILSGNKLTLDANLKVTMTSWASSEYGHVIRTVGADMVINGGNIVAEYIGGAAKSCRGISVLESGNLYINGGYIKSESYNATNYSEAAIQAAGDIYITGGTVDAVSSNQAGLKGTNIYITGGYVKARVGTGALVSSSTTGVISFTGGTVDLLSGTGRPFAYNDTATTQATKEPVVGTGLQGYVGLNPYVVEAYVDTFNKYVKLSYGPVEKNEMPVPTPGGDILLKTTVKFGTLTLELKKYDEVIYTINKATETTDKDGNPMTRYTQTTTGANADNWNAMFVWKSTDAEPTLYLRGFIMDDWNNETSKFAANPNNSYGYYQTYSITTGSEVPLTIVLTGEDSMIECQFGITYNNNLTIKSEGNTKLTMNNQSSCISPNKSAGYSVTIDANLNLTIRSLYNTEFACATIIGYDGDIIINGGTINCKSLDQNKKNVNSITTRGTSGDIIINGGKITGNGTIAAGHKNGAIQAVGKLIINGGEVNSNPNNAVGLYGGQGIEINGGIVNVISPWYAVTSGTKDAGTPIVFNGGTTTIMAEHAFYTGSVLQIGEGVKAYAGSGPKNAEVYDGSDTKLALKPWFLITNDPDKFIEIEEEEEDDLPIFTLPTQAPTQTPDGTDATVAPTDATEAPEATEAPDATEAPEVTEAPDATVAPDATEAPEEEIPESNTKVELIEGETMEIPQTLIDLGLDTPQKILDAMVDSAWTIDENIDRVSFFDAVLMYKEGEEWIKADETHFPEDGALKVVLPYPEGTDENTQFTALHMFTSDAFGKTPGEIELLMPENTEEGIVVYVTGLSPILLGWDSGDEVDPDQDETPDVPEDSENPENPETGDTGIAMFIALLMVAAFGMIAVVFVGKKRIA